MLLDTNIGGGIRFIKPAKLYMCTQKHYKQNKDGHTTLGVSGHGSVLQSHLEKVITKTGLQQRADLETKCLVSASKVQLAKTSLDPELYFYCCFSVYLTSHYSNIS